MPAGWRHCVDGVASEYGGEIQRHPGVQRQRQPCACADHLRGTRHSARQGPGRPLQRRRGPGRDRGKRAPPGGVRHPADFGADRGQFHGAAGAGGCAQARLGGQRHRRAAVFRLCAPGPPAALGARADHRQGRGQDDRHGRHRPRAHGRPARRPDPGASSTSRSTTSMPRRCCWPTSGATTARTT